MNLDAWADEYGDGWQLLNDDQKERWISDRILAQEIAEWDDFMTYSRRYEMGVDMAAEVGHKTHHAIWHRDGF